jgi:hypothetical protein
MPSADICFENGISNARAWSRSVGAWTQTALDYDKPPRTQALVAPQGFTSVENTGDTVASTSRYPDLYPQELSLFSGFSRIRGWVSVILRPS